MKITSHNETFEWRLRLVEWRYAQAALLGTALILVTIHQEQNLQHKVTWASKQLFNEKKW